MRQPGSLGGRDDVWLPGDLPELGRWRFTEGIYLEAEEVGDPGDFPRRGIFAVVELLDSGEEVYVAVTEGMDRMVVQAMEEKGVKLPDLTVDVDTAEKAGEEETAPWRYSASIAPTGEVGPPE